MTARADAERSLRLLDAMERGEATCAHHERPWTDCEPHESSCRFEWFPAVPRPPYDPDPRIPDDWYSEPYEPEPVVDLRFIVAAFVVGFLLWAGIVAWFVWAVS